MAPAVVLDGIEFDLWSRLRSREDRTVAPWRKTTSWRRWRRKAIVRHPRSGFTANTRAKGHPSGNLPTSLAVRGEDLTILIPPDHNSLGARPDNGTACLPTLLGAAATPAVGVGSHAYEQLSLDIWYSGELVFSFFFFRSFSN